MTHYLVASFMPKELTDLFLMDANRLKFETNKIAQNKNGWCNCSKSVKPTIRELRFFEFSIRDDAEVSFEKWLGSWFSNKNYNFVTKQASKKSAKWIFGLNSKHTKISFEIPNYEINLKKGFATNWRNQILMIARCDLSKYIRCQKCKYKIPREWL